MKKLVIIIAGCLLFTHLINGQTAESITATVTDKCWDGNKVIATATQQNTIAVFEKYVFVVFYNSDRYLSLARNSNYGIGTWKIITFDHRYEKRNGIYDNHNTPNVAISPIDKSVHLSFDMHARDLRYKISSANTAIVPDIEFTASRFSATRSFLKFGETQSKVTYPRFVVGKDSTLILFWRGDGGSGNANTYLSHYKGDGIWSSRFQFIDGKTGELNGDNNRCAYFNDIIVDDNARLYASWTWRETSDGTTNHDLMFAYSDDNGVTWINNAGDNVGNKINLNTTGIKVFDIPLNSGLINANGSDVDGEGNFHVIMRKSGKYIHYYRVGTTWSSRELPVSTTSSRPKVYCDRKTNTVYLVFRAGTSNKIYAALSNGAKWDVWKEVSTINNNYFIATNNVMRSDEKTLYSVSVTDTEELHFNKYLLDGVKLTDFTATISTPANNTSIKVDSTIELSASASVNSGSIDHLIFRVNGEEIKQVNEAPYTTTWAPSKAGVHLIDVVAVKQDGAVKYSANVAVLVQSDFSSTDQAKYKTISVYPNPANNYLTINLDQVDFSKANIQIIDISGKTMFNKKQRGSQEQIPIEDFQSGMYLLKLTIEDKVVHRKFIKH